MLRPVRGIVHQASQSEAAEVIVFCPGNGTRYVVVATDITDPASARELGTSAPSTLFTFPLTGKSIILDWEESPLFAWWVGEKLSCSDADANVLTELLASWLHREAVLIDMNKHLFG